MAVSEETVVGTREWSGTDDVRNDLEVILGELPEGQWRLVRRLSAPGPHRLARGDLDRIRAVNWLAEAFWFRHPLVETGPAGAVLAEGARGLVTALLAERPRWGSEA
ncbi:hypothetical protein VA596_15790 [Amycolatopsis sp., V23-08]|uniref:Aminoglycoside phosphotransferase n=1 Tax=Amycolatopsis heterodermiae TaxID=3110235 RepID=A0ABU5R456_9PSEU|nr:hypothetical protein [Amycolatopsis sp., V23-08]MEA5361006.1 hypothetical protein [Amycolatopsis sp., V23-08]